MSIGHWFAFSSPDPTTSKQSRNNHKRKRPAARKKSLEHLELRQMLYGIALGQEVYETLGTVGDRDSFEFSLSQPTRVAVDGLTAGGTAYWTLRNDFENLQVDRDLSAATLILDLAAGDYSLEFNAGSETTFGYSFRVLDVTEPTLINPGSQIDGTLSPAGAVSVYRLNANAGDVFTFDSLTTDTLGAGWRLMDPLNRFVAGTGLSFDLVDVNLAMTGEYLLVIEGSTADTGDLAYSFQTNFVTNNPVPPFTGTPLTLGETVASTITVAGEEHKYTFTLTDDTLLYFDNLASNGAMYWSLEGPSGVVVSSLWLDYDWWYGVASHFTAIAGDYQLTMRGDAAGDYAFKLFDLADAPVVTLDQLTTGRLEPIYATNAYSLPLVAGQSIFLDSRADSTAYARWALVDPLGRTAFSTYANTDIEIRTIVTGDYKLLFESSFATGGDPVDYAFLAHLIADPTTTPINLDTAVESDISQLGERDIYTFTLAGETLIQFDNLGDFASMAWSLTGPTGAVVLNKSFLAENVDELSTYRLSPGDYSLTVDGSGDALGSYWFQLLDLSGAQSLAFDQVISGVLDPAAESQAYQFSATAGDIVFFDSRDSDVANAHWHVLDPLGRVVQLQRAYTDMELLLPMTGTYTLVFMGQFNDTAITDYSFLVHRVVISPPVSISLSTPVADALAGVGDRKQYSFTLGSDTLIRFDKLQVSDGLIWSLSGPTGAVVTNKDLNSEWYDESSTYLLLAGEYLLAIDSFGDAVGPYAFVLHDLWAAPEVAFDTLTSATLDPITRSHVYQFAASSGQTIFFDSLDSEVGDAYWQLLDPLGREVFLRRAYEDVEQLMLISGTYSLLVSGRYIDTDPIDYAFLVRSLVVPLPEPILLDTPVTGSIDNAGDAKRYSFSLGSEKLVRFDTLSISSGLRWSLTGPDGSIESNRTLGDQWYDESLTYRLFPGDYLLTVDGSGSSTGPFSFQLLDLAAAPTLLFDSVTTDTLDPIGESHAYQFAATAGQTIYFDALDSDVDNAVWQVLDPLGQQVALTNAYVDIELVMPLTGNYTLLVMGRYLDTASVDYSFLVRSAVTSPVEPIALDTPVTDSIDGAGDRNVYSFTLPSEKLIRFDNRATASGMVWTLTGPMGTVVTGKSMEAEWYDESSTYRLIAGDYLLTVDGSGASTGSYSFQLLDLGAAPALLFDSVTTDTLDPIGESHAYQFAATAGQTIYFDALDSDVGNAIWQVLDPLGRSMQLSIANTDIELVMPLTGNYTLLVMGRYFETASVDYSFLVRSAVTSPVEPIALDTPVTDSIDGAGDRNVYSFALPSEKLIRFDNRGNAPGMVWTLTGPMGTVVTGKSMEAEWYDEFSTYRLIAGDYLLTVDGSVASTGSYSFQLLDLGAAPALLFDSVTTDTLDPIGESHVYQFAATAGQTIYFDALDSDVGNAVWQVLDPLGQQVASTNAYVDMELVMPLTGNYTLLVMGRYLDSTSVDYAFNVHVTIAPTTPLPLNVPQTGEIANAGDRGVYTFALGADGLVYFDNLNSSTSGLTWTLTGSTGTYVANRSLELDWFAHGVKPIVRLPAGDYQLIIDGANDAVGSYSFQLLEPSASTTITLGMPMGQTLSPPSRTDIYKLNVTAGDAFNFDSLSAAPGNAYWRLLSPYGAEVFAAFQVNDQMNVRLPLTGEYFLVIEGYYIDTVEVEYSFQVDFIDNVPPEPFSGDPLILGEVVTGAIADTAEVDSHIFTLANDSQLYFDALSTSGGLLWSLEGPAGFAVQNRYVFGDGISWSTSGSDVFSLVAGDYRLTVVSDGSATGGYAFKLSDVATAPSFTPGTPVSGTLAAASTDIYRFDVVAGEQFYFDSQTSVPRNSAWHLFDPSGRSVASWHLGYDGGALTLSLAGTYTLMIEGYFYDTESVDYAFNIQPIVETSEELTLGIETSGSIDSFSAIDNYTFDLAIESQIYFDALTADPNIVWSLTGPTGSVVSSRQFSDDRTLWYLSNSPLFRLPAGAYTLTVSGNGGATGAYSFNLSDVATAPTLSPGTLVSGTQATASTDIYRFDVVAGESFYFDSQTSVALSSSWHLFDPWGRTAGHWSLGSDGGALTLPFSGTYTLMVEGYFFDTSPVDYAFNVQPLVETSSVLPLGTLTLGSIDTAGSVNSYTFDLTSESQIYFDALSAAPNIVWSLTGPTGSVVTSRQFHDDGTLWYISNSPLFRLPAGAYTLSVEGGSGATGAYSFKLSDVSTAPTFTSGTLVSGTQATASTDIYRFDVVAGERFYFDSQTSVAQSSSWHLFDPWGRSAGHWFLGSDGGTLTLPFSGTYTLMVEGYFFDTSPVDYAFNVQPLVETSSVLPLGAETSGSIDAAGSVNSYTFDLTSESQIYFDALSAAPNIVWSLTGPTGSVVNSRQFSADETLWYLSNSPLFRLPAGAYTLTVSGNGGATGAYSFNLSDVATAPTLSPGTLVSGTQATASTDIYRFDVVAGESFYFDSQTSVALSSSWHLFDPWGRTAGHWSLGSDGGALTLPFSGTYTLMVEGYFFDTAPVDYAFNVQPIVETIGAVTLGVATPGSIDSPGSIDKYTFALATEGQIYFDALSADPNIVWSLTGPTGSVVSSRQFSDDGTLWYLSNSPLFRLPAGAYTLSVQGASGATGAYSFKLSDVATAPTISPGTLVSGTQAPASTDIYRFEVVAGERFFFDSQTSGALSSAWHLFDPWGRTAGHWFLGSDGGALTLLFSGTYTLMVEGYFFDAAPVDYVFNVQPVVDSTTSLTLGTQVNGSLPTVGAIDRYTFSLLSASQLYFDALSATAGVHWTLTGPSGAIVNTRDIVNDQVYPSVSYSQVFNLPPGQYKLSIQASNDIVGDYSFRLTDLASVAPSTTGLNVSGTLDPGSSTAFYRFDVTAGEHYYFHAQTVAAGNAAWQLFDPQGTSVYSTYLNSSVGPLKLVQNGTYTLMMEGYLYSTDPVNYQFRVQQVDLEPAETILSSTTIAENLPDGTVVGQMITSDIDETSTPVYSLVSGPGDSGNGFFAFSGNELTTTAAFNYEGQSSYSIRVRTTDNLGLMFDRVFTIQVVDVNEAPTELTIAPGSIAENSAPATTVGSFTTTDPDAANTFTYALVAGSGSTDNAAFTISGNSLVAIAGFNYEAKSSYSVRVRTTDQGGLSYEKEFTIDVLDVNETPTNISISSASIPENSPPATAIGSFTTSDQDIGDTFTYTLVSGTGATDNAAFSITGNTLSANSGFDFESQSSYSVRVRTTDAGGLSFDKVLLITVTNVNEAPTNVALSGSSIPENSAVNTAVGTLSSADPDAGGSFTYSLVSGTGDTDNAAFSIIAGALTANAGFDFETKSSYSVRIRTTDQGGLTFDKSFTINVTNVNETPTDIGLSVSTIAENSAANTAVGTLSSVDQDAGDTFTYALVSGTGDADNAAFSITGSTLSANAGFDFETDSSYTVRVRTTDAGGLSLDKVFVITVLNVNETPTDVALSGVTIPENSAANTAVGTLSTTDPDGDAVFTYALVSGTGATDNAAFSITGNTLSANAGFDFESQSSYSVRVRTTDVGGLSFDKVFVITVTDVNEAPTDIGLSSTTIPENSGINSVVGTFSTNDPDAGNSFTYQLVAGTGSDDNSAFTVTGTTLRANSSFDFETKSSYSIRVRTTDQSGASLEKVLTISVADVNETPTVTVNATHVSGNVLTVLTNSGTWSDPELTPVTLTASVGSVVRNSNGTWSWSYTPDVGLDDAVVTVTASDGTNSASTSFTIDALVNVANSAFYYKGSSFAASGVNAALAPGKFLAREGAVPIALTYDNLINTSMGLNGLVFDVAGLAAASLSASDFTFKMSPQGNFNELANPPSSWADAPAPTLIHVTPGTATTAARVRIEWVDNAIANRWLQIRLLPTANTGLRQADTYYIGHLQGELNGQVLGGAFSVTNADVTMVLPIGGVATVGNLRDIDKSGFVMNMDGILIRQSVTANRVLRRITIPASGAGGSMSAGSGGQDNWSSSGVMVNDLAAPPVVATHATTLGRTLVGVRGVGTREELASTSLVGPMGPTVAASVGSGALASVAAKTAATKNSAAAVDRVFSDFESLANEDLGSQLRV